MATVICTILFNKCVTNYIYSKHCFAPNLASTWPIQSKPTSDMSSWAKSWRLDETAVNSLWFANNVNTLRPGNFWGSARYSDSKSRPTVTLQSYSATGRQDAGHVQINVLELCHKIREIREWLALRRTRCSLHAHSASERNVLGFICREVSGAVRRSLSEITQNIGCANSWATADDLRMVRSQGKAFITCGAFISIHMCYLYLFSFSPASASVWCCGCFGFPFIIIIIVISVTHSWLRNAFHYAH